MHARSFSIVGVAIVCTTTVATMASEGSDFSFDDARSLTRRYCADCHSGEEPEADLDLTRLDDPLTATGSRNAWTEVLVRVRSREMPPSDSGLSLEEDEWQQLTQWLQTALRTAGMDGDPRPGPAPIRRLNKYEYSATIRDLLGVHVQAGQALPADGAGGAGFDNTAETLFISPVHLEKYLEAAKFALDYMAKDPPARELIFVATPDEDTSADEAARSVLRRFVYRAFRRPTDDEEIERYMRLYFEAAAREEPFDQAVMYAMQAALISPHFLFRLEQPNDSQAPQRISDYELATRLSYFLWSSMPDDELLQLTEQGKLHEPEILREQVIRMLSVEIGNFARSGFSKARALAENFMGQWLGTRELGGEFIPDKDAFPQYEEQLETAMRYEPVYMFEHIVLKNRPLLDLLDADYTFLTRDLARHYDIDDDVRIRGFGQLTYVDLPPETHRGGVLTMGAVLTVSSYPHRTSPVLRGKWILEKLLGTPPPPPPPDVPLLSEDKEQIAGRTLRERLEIHRQNPTCASCHDRLDPLGFGLENFDAIGRWRTEEAGRPVDTHGTLPNGVSFDGPEGLKGILLERKDDFVRMLTGQMLSYALGRGLVDDDYSAVETILHRLQANEYKAQELILGIVESVPFLYKQGSAEGVSEVHDE